MSDVATRHLIEIEIKRCESLLHQHRDQLADPEREAERMRFIHNVTHSLEAARASLARAAPDANADRRRRILTANHLNTRIPKPEFPEEPE